MATEYYVNQAAVPLGVALFLCPCGAKHVECALRHERVPDGWSTAADGSCRCPVCTAYAAGAERPEQPPQG